MRAETGFVLRSQSLRMGELLWSFNFVLFVIIVKINSQLFVFILKSPNQHNQQQGTAKRPIYSFLVESIQDITSTFCQFMEFWQFGRLVDSKVGLSPPFHCTRSPLDHSVSCGAEQAIISHTRSEAHYFSDNGCQPIKINKGGHWLEGSCFRTNVKFSEAHPRSQNQQVMRNLER